MAEVNIFMAFAAGALWGSVATAFCGLFVLVWLRFNPAWTPPEQYKEGQNDAES